MSLGNTNNIDTKLLFECKLILHITKYKNFNNNYDLFAEF
jgi:hypothetical protein